EPAQTLRNTETNVSNLSTQRKGLRPFLPQKKKSSRFQL
ncbi:MAG: hypothetical protein ACI905_002445, partial [Roseivirga sp.]